MERIERSHEAEIRDGARWRSSPAAGAGVLELVRLPRPVRRPDHGRRDAVDRADARRARPVPAVLCGSRGPGVGPRVGALPRRAARRGASRGRALRDPAHGGWHGLAEHRVRNKADELAKRHFRELAGRLSRTASSRKWRSRARRPCCARGSRRARASRVRGAAQRATLERPGLAARRRRTPDVGGPGPPPPHSPAGTGREQRASGRSTVCVDHDPVANRARKPDQLEHSRAAASEDAGAPSLRLSSCDPLDPFDVGTQRHPYVVVEGVVAGEGADPVQEAVCLGAERTPGIRPRMYSQVDRHDRKPFAVQAGDPIERGGAGHEFRQRVPSPRLLVPAGLGCGQLREHLHLGREAAVSCGQAAWRVDRRPGRIGLRGDRLDKPPRGHGTRGACRASRGHRPRAAVGCHR